MADSRYSQGWREISPSCFRFTFAISSPGKREIVEMEPVPKAIGQMDGFATTQELAVPDDILVAIVGEPDPTRRCLRILECPAMKLVEAPRVL